jgi:outer membrane protein
MKQLSLILSIIALGLATVLLFLHFKKDDSAKPPYVTTIPSPVNTTSPNSSFKIAYFELDSLQNNYQYFKDELNKLKTKEESEQAELAQMEQEAANREYQEMQQNFQARKQQLDQNISDQVTDTRKKIRAKLESYLKDYNKDKNYSYIFSDFPEAIFYKDTLYNITNDLIKGLNESYKKKN